MQNKANLQNSQMDISLIIRRDYEKKSKRTLGENKAKQSQYRSETYEKMTDDRLSDHIEILGLKPKLKILILPGRLDIVPIN